MNTLSAFSLALVGAFAVILSIPHLHRAHAQIEGGSCGDGPSAIIFLHDQYQDSTSFAGVWDVVCADPNIRAVRYDRRGYGQSPAPTTAYSDASDLHAILQSLNVTQATLVSSGNGAGLAVTYALQNPAAVNGLVLSSPTLEGFTVANDISRLASISVPALVLTGATDTAESLLASQAITKALPEASTVVMLSASRYIVLERPGAVAQYVLDFVSALSSK